MAAYNSSPVTGGNHSSYSASISIRASDPSLAVPMSRTTSLPTPLPAPARKAEGDKNLKWLDSVGQGLELQSE